MAAVDLSITPVDAWFFRDSRPYDKDESAQAGVRSLFPPHPQTVIGALRAGLARSNGWDGRSRWNEKHTSVLGDGYEDLGQLDFRGPFLLEEGSEALFPAPLSVLGIKSADGKWKPATRLQPGDNRVTCDLGEDVRLPEPDNEVAGLKRPNGVWVTTRGLQAALEARVPEPAQVRHADQLFHREARIGLQRDPESRTTGTNALYSPSYVRTASSVSLWERVGGVPDDWKVPERTPFGGESRLADIDKIAGNVSLPSTPADTIRQTGRAILTFVTPLRLDRNLVADQLVPNADLPPAFADAAGAKLISACIGKPVFIGGWNSLEHRPLALEAYLPAGTTLFLDVENHDIDALVAMHDSNIGQRTAHGFGHVFVGTW